MLYVSIVSDADYHTPSILYDQFLIGEEPTWLEPYYSKLQGLCHKHTHAMKIDIQKDCFPALFYTPFSESAHYHTLCYHANATLLWGRFFLLMSGASSCEEDTDAVGEVEPALESALESLGEGTWKGWMDGWVGGTGR